MRARLLRDPALIALAAASAILVACLLAGVGGVRLFWSALPVYDLVMWYLCRRVANLPELPPGWLAGPAGSLHATHSDKAEKMATARKGSHAG